MNTIHDIVHTVMPSNYDVIQGYYATESLMQNTLEKIPGEHITFNLSKGNALVKLGKEKEAITAYNEAIRINPEYSNAYHNKGKTLEKLGKEKEAKKYFDKAKKNNH